jgi:hypothetical protein
MLIYNLLWQFVANNAVPVLHIKHAPRFVYGYAVLEAAVGEGDFFVVNNVAII